MEKEPVRGKFPDQRAEVLWLFSMDGWCNQQGGRSNSPTGWYAAISNSKEELSELLEAFEEEVGHTGFTATETLVGHFLLREDEQGFVDVTEFSTKKQLDTVFEQLEATYNAWLGGDEL